MIPNSLEGMNWNKVTITLDQIAKLWSFVKLVSRPDVRLNNFCILRKNILFSKWLNIKVIKKELKAFVDNK